MLLTFVLRSNLGSDCSCVSSSEHLGHITGIFEIKGKLMLADFTVKTGRFYPGHDEP
jgi:hypothetical protein